MKKTINKIFNWAEIDYTTFFSILARLWGFVAGPVTLIIIVAYFTESVQGYYMTFIAIIGFSTFAELGLGRIIIQFASHEWASLKTDKTGKVIGNDESFANLSSLSKFSAKWFSIASIFIIIVLGISGFIFLSVSKQPAIPVAWKAQWIAVCILLGLDFFTYFIWYLLEGAGQVSYMYKFKLWRGIVGNLVIWIAIYCGAGLWTYSIYYFVGILMTLFLVIRKYKVFLKSLLFSQISQKSFNWSKEILPMQWQITIISICGYFMFQSFTGSAMFERGPERAGQVGMTWTMIIMLGWFMSALIAPKMPKFGILIAQKKYKELDVLFLKVYFIGCITMIAGGIALATGVYVLNAVSLKIFEHYSQRILPILPTLIFLIAFILWTLMSQLGSYFIAHKKTPHWWIVVSATIFTSLSTWFLGGKYGLVGAGIGLIVVFIIHSPIMFWMWRKCRREWQNS